MDGAAAEVFDFGHLPQILAGTFPAKPQKLPFILAGKRSPIGKPDPMKPAEPSATHCVRPMPAEEEQTGKFRLPMPVEEERTGKFRVSPQRRQELEVTAEVEGPRTPRPVVAVRHHRILLAATSDSVVSAFLPIIRALDAAVVKVDDGAALERALSRRGPFGLVLSDAFLPGSTGLGVLASQRRSGHRPPFIIVQSIHEQLVRVVVGGGSRGILATRVVNDMALIELAEDLLGIHDAPASSRRPQRIA
jgi:CheY-like chemotaxis protein